MPRRASWHLLIAASLVVLLAALGTLQYRWLGDVSEAERERMRAGLRTRSSDFSDAVNRELTRIYVAFHVDGRQIAADPGRALADAFAQWKRSTPTPTVVEAVCLLESNGDAGRSLKKLDPDRGVLEAAPSLPSLEKFRVRVETHMAGLPMPLLPDAVDASIPALVVHVPIVAQMGSDAPIELRTVAAVFTRAIVIVLNADELRQQIVAPLVTKYFPSDEYLVTIARRDDPATIVYTTGGNPPLDASGADVVAGLFDLRMEDVALLNLPEVGRGPGTPTATTAKMAFTVVRRGSGFGGGRLVLGGADAQGAWQARIRYRSGPLETIVAQSRRRNLAIGLGVLGLLAGSFLLIIASARRQQRLAQQQIEFVAAVSHELRTPLAVIRSAGENLADGVVAGDAAVKRYGTLIETEGRRLTDMVERVMEFAGISSGTTARGRAEVDLLRVIAASVAGARVEGEERGIDVAVDAPASLPPVVGDADALRSALQNVVGNAVKYSPNGERVQVGVHVHGDRVRLTVADRGIGIDDADLKEIFKPFFRGRRAADAQIRGAGIGLAVVRHVIDAHQGDIRVDSTVGEGTTVTIDLPLNAIDASSAIAAPRNASA
jgi:signal transduction histidine kinase